MRTTLLVSLFSMLFTMGCGNKDSESDTGDAVNSGEDINGAAVWALNCSACHGSDGRGVSAPDLTVAVPSLSDSDLMDILENGTGSMAAPSLDPAEEDALFLYLRENFGEHGGG